MPRKKVVSIADSFVEFCMKAKIDEVASLLKVGTQIVKVRAGSPTDVPLPIQAPRRPRISPVPPTGQARPLAPVRAASPADKVDLERASQAAQQATGGAAAKPRRPRGARPPVSDLPPTLPPQTGPVPLEE